MINHDGATARLRKVIPRQRSGSRHDRLNSKLARQVATPVTENTPVAYAEVYTALQSGAIDGQDNPLVASRLMKFYEVTSQFVLTGHVIGYDVMVITTKLWDAMSPDQRAKFQAAAEKAIDEYTTKYNAIEKEAIEFFKSQGKKIYTPDLTAFRSFAQKKYAEKYGADWPKGKITRRAHFTIGRIC